MPNDEINDNPNVSNWVVIPYFTGDKGFPAQRPITLPVVSYLCPSIQVLSGGVPAPAFFTPGEDLEIKVTVGNYGNGTLVGHAKVSVFWMEATSGGFVGRTLLGMQSVAVANWGPVKATAVIKGKIPSGITGHICLLAGVEEPVGDPLPPGIDPINDRHWAQLNLTNVKLAANHSFQIMFWAGNPSNRARAFDLVARPVDERSIRTLSRHLRAQAVVSDQMGINLTPIDGDFLCVNREQSTDAQITIKLKGKQRQAVHLQGQLNHPLEKGTFTAVEIDQVSHEDQHTIGSLGVVIMDGSKE